MAAASLVRPVEVAKLYELRDKIALAALGSRHQSADCLEWSRMSREHKIVFVLLAGIDADTETVDKKDWREFAEPERFALQYAMRSMRETMGRVYALLRK